MLSRSSDNTSIFFQLSEDKFFLFHYCCYKFYVDLSDTKEFFFYF